MKGQHSVYSRPTTAKKTFPSPKTYNKNIISIKMKTQVEQPEVIQNSNQILQKIQEYISIQKQYQANGQYVEAQQFKRKVKQLRELLEDYEFKITRQKHNKQLKQLKEAHLAEKNLFELEWQKKMGQMHKQAQQILKQLQQRQLKQIKYAEDQFQNNYKFKESPKLLQLRKIQTNLGKQQKYIQAHKIQVQANKLEKQEKDKYQKQFMNKNKINLNSLKIKHNNQFQAVTMRIQQQIAQLQRQRDRQLQKLNLKYQNTVKLTNNAQTHEVTQMSKLKKLGTMAKINKHLISSRSKQP